MKKTRGYSFKLLTLLSTASVSIAPVALMSAAGVLLAPSTAFAINECSPAVDPTVNGATADSYICTGSYVGTGITYTASGPLIITGTNAHLVGPVGINLTATGADTISWNQDAGLITGTHDAVMGVTTATGAITIDTLGITGTSAVAGAQVTYGILASSTSGAITITDGGTINVNSTAALAAQIAAIRASTSGAITVTTNGAVTGRQYGIQTVNTGNGAQTVNANNSVSISTTTGVPVAAIDLANGAGTGAMTVNVGTTTNPGTGTVNGGVGAAIRTTSTGTGAQTINIATGRTVSVGATSTGAINLTGAGAKTITNAGTLTGGNATGVAVLVNTGTNVTLTNSGSMTGRLSLGGATGTTTMTNSGTWTSSGTSAFTTGASTLTNSGTLTVSGASTFTSLETLNNTGTIALGSSTLTSAGTTFTGTGASLITVTVAADGTGGRLNLTNGVVTSGTANLTGIRVSGAGTTDTSVFSATPIVLVDVTGGTALEGDEFVLDTGSTNYADGVISSGGLFGLALTYNGAQQFVLASVPVAGAYEYAPAMHQAVSVWNTTTDAVVGRQADLQEGSDGGVWVRILGEHSNRDFDSAFSTSGTTFDNRTSYSLDTAALVFGFQLGSGAMMDGDYNVGIHGGLVRTKAEFNGTDSTNDMDGVTTGLYGGWNSGIFSLDAVVNANLLSLDHNSAAIDVSTNVISIGGRAEGAWRLPLSGTWAVEPLVAASYVHTDIKEVFPDAYQVTYNDVDSMRVGVGVRLTANGDTSIGTVGFWATGRIWNEFADEANIMIQNTTGGDDFVIDDDMSGQFEELSVGFTLGSADGLQGFISGGSKFQPGIDNYNVTAGLRWAW
jgi:fibronectin-binding autotransporter adhesin